MNKLKTLSALCLLLACAFVAGAQTGKGSDSQKESIRDAGSDRAAGNNGNKTDVGAGRGFDFGRGRTPAAVLLPNPYRLIARRDAVINAVQELITERKMVLDEAATKPEQGIIVSQPYTFSKGASIAQSDLSRYATDSEVNAPGGYTRARYTMIIEIIPTDATTTDVSVSARVEGRIDSVSGSQWLTLQSSGVAEQEFLAALAEKLGASPTPN